MCKVSCEIEMSKQKIEWFNGLKQFIGECRKKHPIASRDELKVEDEMQCQVIGGNLIAWLEDYGPCLLKERSFLAGIKGWEKDPFIVFTSTEPGLVAANEILKKGPDDIAVLYPKEFTEWLEKNPDTDYLWHIHMWSCFVVPDTVTEEKTNKYTLAQGESYRLHKEGTICGPLFGKGGEHLWKWNCRELILLRECINQWVS